MKEILQNVYNNRNLSKRLKSSGHGLFELERGDLFRLLIGTGKKIVDLGCRDCSLTTKYSSGNETVGIDVDPQSLGLCPSEIKTQVYDLNGDWHLGKKGMFDVVVASEVIEHLYYPDVVVNKIHSVLKPGGSFVGSVPNAFNLKNRIRLFFANKVATPLGEPTHINHFSHNELKKILESKFDKVDIFPIVQKKWAWLARLFPGMASFLLAFKATKFK